MLVPSQNVLSASELVKVGTGRAFTTTAADTVFEQPLPFVTFTLTFPAGPAPHVTLTKLSRIPPPPVIAPPVTVQFCEVYAADRVYVCSVPEQTFRGAALKTGNGIALIVTVFSTEDPHGSPARSVLKILATRIPDGTAISQVTCTVL